VAVGVAFDGAAIAGVGFEAEGCLICVAAASLMCEAVDRQSLAQARDLSSRYLDLVASRAATWPEELGALAAFAAVARFPARAPCASLAWQALQEAIAYGPSR
jgi:nitrogen fixation NifU-like protein